ncbi:MAG: hypothetical protein K0R57_406 [Paenibacillaceae bacterium]|jgi:membrane protease subunit (stomatin/prohibitin family)|nr:hypothetical protein [Paenibacillaceae bacterium]
MAIIDVVKFDGPPDMLVWKFPNPELSTWTQLIVNESQEALLFKGGQALDLFGAGRHTLTTQNIPFLSTIVNLPFGKKSPFAAEVWFVNKVRAMELKWGTSTPIQLQEPKYQMFVAVRAFGQLAIQIEDSRKFLLRLVGTLPKVTQEELTNYFRGILMMNIKEFISSYVIHKKISVLDVNAYISEISSHVAERIIPAFQEAGIRVVNFNIDSINIPENDPATIRLKEALAKKAEMDILGFTYHQERTFNTLENAAKNEGGQSVLMNTGIGLGMGLGVGGAVGGVMPHLAEQMQVAPQRTCPQCQDSNPSSFNFCKTCGHSFKPAGGPAKNQIICHNCQQPMPEGIKFCPHCGDSYNPCPSCKADNPRTASQCTQCGADLGRACRECGTIVSKEVKFCPDCGTSMVIKCGQCQQEVQPGQKFCFECGNKLI